MYCFPIARQLLVAVVKVKIEREQVVLQKGINVESMLMVSGEGRRREKGTDHSVV